MRWILYSKILIVSHIELLIYGIINQLFIHVVNYRFTQDN